MSSWFGGPSPSHNSHSRHRDSSPKGYFVRPKSPQRSHSDSKGYFVRSHSPARSTTSSFSRSIFGGGSGRHHSSSSYYKRRPRDGYISQLVYKIKRLLRDLIRYAQKNPIKIFMLVIMPLVTGGALHSLLRSMGIKLPAAVAGMMGGNKGGFGGGGGYGGFEREQRGGGGGGMDVGQIMNIAKMFI